MHGAELLVPFAVLCVVGGLLVLAGRLTTPYPILLVVGGVLLGLVPGMPDVEVDPDVILLVALPPLLYQAAFFSSLREMRDNARPILSLAIGLVWPRRPASRSWPTRSPGCRGRRRSCWGPSCRRPTRSRPPRSRRASARPGAS